MKYYVNYTDKIYGTLMVEADSEEEAERKAIEGEYDKCTRHEETGDLVITYIELVEDGTD